MIKQLLFLILLLHSHESLALQPPSGLSSNQTSVNCYDYCKQFGPSAGWTPGAGQPTPSGLTKSTAWSDSVDGLLCCELASGNSKYHTTSTCPATLPSPAPSYAPDTCSNVTISASILKEI